MADKLQKIYILRKYVVANSVEGAIKKDKETKVDDCWLEENSQKSWLESKLTNTKIGFGK